MDETDKLMSGKAVSWKSQSGEIYLCSFLHGADWAQDVYDNYDDHSNDDSSDKDDDDKDDDDDDDVEDDDDDDDEH